MLTLKGKNLGGLLLYIQIYLISQGEIYLNIKLTLCESSSKLLDRKSVLLGHNLIIKAMKQVYKGLVNYL